MWWRSTHNFLTNPAFILPSLIFPLFFFTAFAGGLSSVGDVPGFDYAPGYTAFQYCFVLLQASAFGGVFTGFGIASDFENGFARRLLLAAPNRLAILVGYMLTALTRATIVIALLTASRWPPACRWPAARSTSIGILGLAYLVSQTATLFAAGVALRTRTIQAGPAMQMPVFLILFLAPVYVPAALLAGWVKAVAEVNPLTPLIEAVRALLAGGDADVLGAFAIALALVAAFGLWAVRGMRRAEAAGGLARARPEPGRARRARGDGRAVGPQGLEARAVGPLAQPPAQRGAPVPAARPPLGRHPDGEVGGGVAAPAAAEVAHARRPPLAGRPRAAHGASDRHEHPQALRGPRRGARTGVRTGARRPPGHGRRSVNLASAAGPPRSGPVPVTPPAGGGIGTPVPLARTAR